MLESLKSKLVALFYRVWALPIRFGVLSLVVMVLLCLLCLLCLLGMGYLCYFWCFFCLGQWLGSYTQAPSGVPFIDFQSNYTWYLVAFFIGFFTLLIL